MKLISSPVNVMIISVIIFIIQLNLVSVHLKSYIWQKSSNLGSNLDQFTNIAYVACIVYVSKIAFVAEIFSINWLKVNMYYHSLMNLCKNSN